MRKGISFLIVLFFFTNGHAQTLFTFGNKSVSKSEFLEAYNKNDQGGVRNDSTYKAYLDLYIKYRLKIQAAYDEKVDTLQSIKEEVAGYRDQVLGEYLRSQSGYERIAELEWKRAAKEILLQQIILPSNQEEKAKQAYKELKVGKPFEEVATAYSNDPYVSINKGTAGYITAMVLPYDIETKLYDLKPGEFSTPFLSSGKWIILKNGAERPSRGKVKVRQILLTIPPDANESERNNVKRKADSLYTLLKDGSSFSELANQFSEDQFSFNHGGELPAFGTGVYDPVFEEIAFGLKEEEISVPFETGYGFHILKLDKKIAYTSTLDSLARAELIDQVQSGDREMLATKQLIERISSILKVKEQPVDKSSLAQFTKSILANPSSVADMGLKPSTVLISMNGKNITVSEYRKYLKELGQAGNFGDQPAEDFYEGFRQNVILDYYQQNIEKFDPVFKKQILEFKEGSMLFYMMEKYVWSVSAADTAGARKYFELNKDRYWWNKSADVLVFTSANKELIETIKEAIVKVPEKWEEIRDKYETQLTVDSARYEFSQLPGSPAELKNGETTPVVQMENMYSVAYAVNVYNDRSPRTYEEAQGLVINDYQALLEEKWINKLKKKYPVKIEQGSRKGL